MSTYRNIENRNTPTGIQKIACDPKYCWRLPHPVLPGTTRYEQGLGLFGDKKRVIILGQKSYGYQVNHRWCNVTLGLVYDM
eukprot:396895-Amorphochlora_amoeboformis.AAC.1